MIGLIKAGYDSGKWTKGNIYNPTTGATTFDLENTKKLKDNLLLPTSGRRQRNFGSVVEIHNVYLWSGTPASDIEGYAFSLTGLKLEPAIYKFNADGYAVRCFKD